jgi:ubiquinone/menaquinone biosynthesis C-methylase UbiE
MEKYKNLLISKEKKAPAIKHKGKIYYRYMDMIYIPTKAEKLSTEDVIALSEARTMLDKKVIDYSYSKKVINTLLNEVEPESNIIDFGCGNGLLLDIMKDRNFRYESLIGLDVSERSLQKAKNKAKKLSNYKSNTNFILFGKYSNLDLSSDSFDYILSSFVMHFQISDRQLEELHRVLKPNGLFVYNDFNFKKSPKTTVETIKRLNRIGFDVEMRECHFEQDSVSKPQKIIVAKKV